ALHHEVLAHKSPFLNSTGWSVRAILYWLVWMLIAIGYFRLSRRQDESKDMALTRRMQWFAPLSMIGFGLTLTFASFDWLMALEPAWYSTIFGVQFFSGAAVTIYAVIILLALGLAKAGHLGKAVNVEHFHDHGKLLFGFVCFWAYISFSQWMLIWYAGIPEEATYYHRRWSGGWEFVSVFLIFGHFVGPFIYGMSRLMKRNLERLKLIAAWMLVMHIVDVYWLVMPYASAEPHLSVNPTDFAALLLMGGAFFLVVFLLMRRIPLVPVGDPRLARSISHVQSH
ncbi:MAG: hypothetical protein OEY14_13790, partial [Myxococcales bacterium]|nr:hypothetical protein [Myxococcales bacterium]